MRVRILLELGDGGRAGDNLTAGAARNCTELYGALGSPSPVVLGFLPFSYFLGTFEFTYQTKIIQLFNKVLLGTCSMPGMVPSLGLWGWGRWIWPADPRASVQAKQTNVQVMWCHRGD